MFLKKPEVFHGNHKKVPFFEGWYHKMSLKNGKSIVLIPGMFRSSEVNNETAFLMLREPTLSYGDDLGRFGTPELMF